MSELQSLPLFHQIAGQPVLVLGEGEAAEPKRRLVERAGGVVIADLQEGIARGARLAFVAYEDAEQCVQAAAQLREAGLLVNVVDRPELCDFTTPSILDRNPVLVAVGTSGASAGLAKHLRLRLEQILPQSLGRLASALFNARPQLRETFPDSAERRRSLDAALGEGGRLDPFNRASHLMVGQWLSNPEDFQQERSASFTVTSPDPEELTLKQARLLGEADVIYADPAIPPAILARARADAQRFSLPDTGEMPELGDGLTLIIHWACHEDA